MAASLEKALAKLIAKCHDRIRGADCQVVVPLGCDRNALVLQETTLQHLLPRPKDDAALVEMAEHANHGGVSLRQIEAGRSLCMKAFSH